MGVGAVERTTGKGPRPLRTGRCAPLAAPGSCDASARRPIGGGCTSRAPTRPAASLAVGAPVGRSVRALSRRAGPARGGRSGWASCSHAALARSPARGGRSGGMLCSCAASTC